MRQNIRNFVECFSKNFDIIEPIVEIGSFIVPGQEDIANLRSIFTDKEFIGCDLRNGNGVDRIENVECLSLSDESVGIFLILDTLEHVENCFQSLEEIHRVLKDGGIVVMSSVMDFPIHDYPSDYWRFTPEAFKLLLKKFPIKIIGMQGNPDQPHTIFAIGIKSTDLSKYSSSIDLFKKNIENDIELNTIEKIKYIPCTIHTIIRSIFDKKAPVFKIYHD